ncbi:MAG: hypothetical protein V1716_03175 [Candidatus Uhrbacteria bacterium]
MSTQSKTLITIWLSSFATFTITAGYIVPQEQSINVPGELGEVFFATGFIILPVLVVASIVIVFAMGRK